MKKLKTLTALLLAFLMITSMVVCFAEEGGETNPPQGETNVTAETNETTEPAQNTDSTDAGTEPEGSISTEEVTEPESESTEENEVPSTENTEPASTEPSSETNPTEPASDTEPSSETNPTEPASDTEPSSETTPTEPSSETEPTTPTETQPTEPTETEPLKTPVYQAGRLLIGWQYSDGSIEFIPQDTVDRNGNALYLLLNNDKAKTIILPATTIRVKRTLFIGNNTTIIATGATIVMDASTGAKPIIDHAVDKTDYKSLTNVKIKGGKWMIDSKSIVASSVMRFMHASDITIENVNIPVKYGEHALSFVACKNATVKNSKFISSGKCAKDNFEEPVQLDIATPFTAPNCARVGAKFAAGQTCKNIKIIGCTIKGGRGIVANKAAFKNKAWQKKNGVSGTEKQVDSWNKNHHIGITIKNCTVTGVSSNGVMLYNCAKVTVTGCTIITHCKTVTGDARYNSVALQIRSHGTGSAITKYENKIENNTVKGNFFGLYVGSLNPKNADKTKYKYAKTAITGNKLYSKRGKGYALYTINAKVSKKNNKTYKWK